MLTDYTKKLATDDRLEDDYDNIVTCINHSLNSHYQERHATKQRKRGGAEQHSWVTSATAPYNAGRADCFEPPGRVSLDVAEWCAWVRVAVENLGSILWMSLYGRFCTISIIILWLSAPPQILFISARYMQIFTRAAAHDLEKNKTSGERSTKRSIRRNTHKTCQAAIFFIASWEVQPAEVALECIQAIVRRIAQVGVESLHNPPSFSELIPAILL